MKILRLAKKSEYEELQENLEAVNDQAVCMIRFNGQNSSAIVQEHRNVIKSCQVRSKVHYSKASTMNA